MHTCKSRIQRDGVSLALRSWGPDRYNAAGKPVVVLVHGYPDCSHVWDRVAPLLAEHYHVVAYDVRGAGESDAPRVTRAYRLAELALDFEAVIDAVSPEAPVHLIAHDWGSIQSWEPVTEPRLAGRIASFTSISGPSIDHAAHWIRKRLKSGRPQAIRQVGGQVAHSWYIALFQLPVLAPTLWRTGLGRLWPTLLQRVEGIDAPISPTQVQDGHNGVKLYRANFGPRLARARERRTDVPVQVIIPTRDNYVLPRLFEDLPQWVTHLWQREIDAGHWLPLSQPDLLARQAREFIEFIETGRATAALKQAQRGQDIASPAGRQRRSA